MKRFAWFVTKKRWFHSYIKAHQVQNTPVLFDMHQNICLHYFQCTYSHQEEPTHHSVAKTAIVQFSICRHPKKKGRKTLGICSRGEAFSGGWWAAAKCCLCVIQMRISVRISVLHPWVLDLTEQVGLTWVFPVILIKVLFYSGQKG